MYKFDKNRKIMQCSVIGMWCHHQINCHTCLKKNKCTCVDPVYLKRKENGGGGQDIFIYFTTIFLLMHMTYQMFIMRRNAWIVNGDFCGKGVYHAAELSLSGHDKLSLWRTVVLSFRKIVKIRNRSVNVLIICICACLIF